ncbi:MAG: tetratricopeptide repeat protein [Calditrichaeota bacterium]|nr:tetratricopeptide repeat protein [Calditrichota bacterium]
MRCLHLGLTIVLSLVLAGCAARQQSTLPEETDEAYRDRILSMLESEEGTKQGQEKTGAAAAQEASTSAPQKEATSAPSLSESLYASTQARYEALQSKLRARQATLDSLRRVLASADQEMARLEQQVNEARSAPATTVARSVSVAASSFEAQYQAALSLVERQNFQRAITEFEKLIAVNPRHPLADNCQYWIGQCYYDLGRYDEAIAAFLKVFSFAATDKYDDAHLMICKSYIALGERAAARAELNSFLLHHPTSEYRAAAEALLRRL